MSVCLAVQHLRWIRFESTTDTLIFKGLVSLKQKFVESSDFMKILIMTCVTGDSTLKTVSSDIPYD